jgi:hypothetical protein
MVARPCPGVRCKALIPLERLEALPGTRLCVQCSREVGGEFDVTVVPHNSVKCGSLKMEGIFSEKNKKLSRLSSWVSGAGPGGRPASISRRGFSSWGI